MGNKKLYKDLALLVDITVVVKRILGSEIPVPKLYRDMVRDMAEVVRTMRGD